MSTASRFLLHNPGESRASCRSVARLPLSPILVVVVTSSRHPGFTPCFCVRLGIGSSRAIPATAVGRTSTWIGIGYAHNSDSPWGVLSRDDQRHICPGPACSPCGPVVVAHSGHVARGVGDGEQLPDGVVDGLPLPNSALLAHWNDTTPTSLWRLCPLLEEVQNPMRVKDDGENETRARPQAFREARGKKDAANNHADGPQGQCNRDNSPSRRMPAHDPAHSRCNHRDQDGLQRPANGCKDADEPDCEDIPRGDPQHSNEPPPQLRAQPPGNHCFGNKHQQCCDYHDRRVHIEPHVPAPLFALRHGRRHVEYRSPRPLEQD
jgi:hypothetical protein